MTRERINLTKRLGTPMRADRGTPDILENPEIVPLPRTPSADKPPKPEQYIRIASHEGAEQRISPNGVRSSRIVPGVDQHAVAREDIGKAAAGTVTHETVIQTTMVPDTMTDQANQGEQIFKDVLNGLTKK
jgi:hypothetical protein